MVSPLLFLALYVFEKEGFNKKQGVDFLVSIKLIFSVIPYSTRKKQFWIFPLLKQEIENSTKQSY